MYKSVQLPGNRQVIKWLLRSRNSVVLGYQPILALSFLWHFLQFLFLRNCMCRKIHYYKDPNAICHLYKVMAR